MTLTITKKDVETACAPTLWDLSNQVLYDLCQKFPSHTEHEVIIAKVLLIGRVYAAAIERRKEKDTDEGSDDFYINTVAPTLKKSELDRWLAALPGTGQLSDPWNNLGDVVTLHKQLTDIFSQMTGMDKRSLASKYLHFHRPDLFFIYDSRAEKAIKQMTPRLNQIRSVNPSQYDSEYLKFCKREQFLRDQISERFGELLTPRQIDNLLLRTAINSKR
jgi:hypothetical protein